MKFSVQSYTNTNSISKWIDYKKLTEDLKSNYGVTIKNYSKPGDSPSFQLDNYVAWECSEGWAVAELIEENYCNHLYFNQGYSKIYDYRFSIIYNEYDLENAINYVLNKVNYSNQL